MNTQNFKGRIFYVPWDEALGKHWIQVHQLAKSSLARWQKMDQIPVYTDYPVPQEVVAEVDYFLLLPWVKRTGFLRSKKVTWWPIQDKLVKDTHPRTFWYWVVYQEIFKFYTDLEATSPQDLYPWYYTTNPWINMTYLLAQTGYTWNELSRGQNPTQILEAILEILVDDCLPKPSWTLEG